jgi:uncharacterized SAM-binding protein YcdF (DUF218 family)
MVILLLAIAVLALLWRRKSRTGALTRVAALAAGAAALLYLISLPALASRIVSPLERRFLVPPLETLKQADCLIVLSGGAEQDNPSHTTAARLAEAAALHHELTALGRPLPLLLCGGSVSPSAPVEARLAAVLLARMGIPRGIMIEETQSRTTWENALQAAGILRGKGLHYPILLTSAIHLQRAELAFRRAGIRALPYPADFRGSLDSANPLSRLLPDAGALSLLRDALWEYLGIVWYRVRR